MFFQQKVLQVFFVSMSLVGSVKGENKKFNLITESNSTFPSIGFKELNVTTEGNSTYTSIGSIRGRKLATCGGGNRGDGICPDGTCCSQWGWCGSTADHCSGSGGSSSGSGTCGGGSRGNGVCADGTCCSQWGWCGTTAEHCSGSGSSGGQGLLGDWEFCTSSSQCQNGCCSSTYSNDGKLKCTPLSGGFRSDICVAQDGSSGSGGTGSSSGSGTSLYSGSGRGTFYYDITGRACFGGAPYAENQGYPTCTSFDPSFWQRLQDYGTNNIVAIDNTLLSTPEGRSRFCGKQIKVYKNGVEVSGGPFVVFDGCAACVGGGIIDFSLSALDIIDNGNACNDGVVPGISWDVIDNQIIPFVP